MSSWDNDRIIYRDIWADSLRLIVDGKDVTMFRGVPSQIGGYQLQRPFGFGPADFAFPGVTHFEALGEGDLWWLRQGAEVRLVPVVNGVRGERDVWRGFTTIPRTTDGHVQVHCDGDASGRLALRIKPPALFTFTKDIGLLAYEAFRHVGLPFTPRLGIETGIFAENRGNGSTYLEYVNDLLSNLTAGGGQYSIDPVWVDGHLKYELVEKDATTVHATVMCGTEGVREDLADDLQERPNTYYGTGIDPTGQKWINATAPGLVQGDTPAYPGPMSIGTTNADTADGYGVTVLQVKLVGTGHLSRTETGDGIFDAETAEGVEEVQEAAGLPVTGAVDRATWDAIFDLSATGLSLHQAGVLPLAQASRVREWNRTSNGSIASRNDGFDEDAVQVDVMVDHGPGVRKRRAVHWSKRALQRSQNGDNLVGTLSFEGADLFAGDVNHNTPDKQILHRLDLRPGMNIRFRNYQGGNPILHVSGVNVDGSMNVRAAVDSKGRDLLTVGQIIARNHPSRSNPAREWLQSFRGRPTAFDSMIVWSEIGGLLGADVQLTGGTWNVFEVVAGQEGTIAETTLTTDSPTPFYMAVFGRKINDGVLNRMVPSPGVVDENGDTAWTDPDVTDWLEREQIMVYAAGTAEQPCGYWPKKHTGPNGNTTAHPVTGVWVDKASFGFRTFADPVLYVAVWPEADCVVKAGRIFKPQHEEGS